MFMAICVMMILTVCIMLAIALAANLAGIFAIKSFVGSCNPEFQSSNALIINNKSHFQEWNYKTVTNSPPHV